MPCQCSTIDATTDALTADVGCGCDTAAGCDCSSGAPPARSERELKLERIVMDLDKRLRRIEAGR